MHAFRLEQLSAVLEQLHEGDCMSWLVMYWLCIQPALDMFTLVDDNPSKVKGYVYVGTR